ncbi:hypothetical protein L5M36_21315 [Shewanella sp. SM72]|uniref:hypothetical protein n=1 Tax=unclassified Shewanella TaxID=196818 RepID=UPI0021DB1360|nr:MULTISPECIES: hypothetical protein [unclassified Shewanella]MCU8014055.1 hypothetical protein [Shewanella sp. SM74]MCU8019403.1 hypothetical protein [Shewanella sp. SM72]MCU8022836.1 hypothetical protein [Shewanella sp. SM78]MCU8079826.1 hypothetical protein [Shewanella sp. SM103]
MMESTANDLELIRNQLGVDVSTLKPISITGLSLDELERISTHIECGKSFVNCCRTHSILGADAIVQGIVIIAIGDDAIALEHRWLKRSDYYLDPTFCFFNSTSKHDDTCVLGYYQQIEIDTQVGANDSLSEISSLLVHTLAKQRATA